MATYLVTGGCGYLGSRLVGRLMEQGHYVRVLDNLRHGVPISAVDCVELNIGDVCDFDTVKHFMKGVEGCFHLADLSECSIARKATRDINATLTGGFNVFSAAALNKVKVVYVSSSAVYGDNAELPLSEASEPCPLTPYAADKRALELHAKVASMNDRVPTVGLRLFNLYGEHYAHELQGQDVVSTFIQHILANKPIRIFGHGQQTRDFVYADDAIRFITAAMHYTSSVPEIFNICSGQGTSIRALAERIMRLAGQDVPIVHEPSRAGDINGSYGCPRRSREKLACTTQMPLNEGLRKLIDFYSSTQDYSQMYMTHAASNHNVLARQSL